MTKGLERIEELLEDQKHMSEAGRELLRTNPLGYSASRNRSLRAAIFNGDEEQVTSLVQEASAVVGRINAQWWLVNTVGKIVEKSHEERS